MTIAVTGATGQLGRLVIDKLKAKAGEAIVALVRSPASALQQVFPNRAPLPDQIESESVLLLRE